VDLKKFDLNKIHDHHIASLLTFSITLQLEQQEGYFFSIHLQQI